MPASTCDKRMAFCWARTLGPSMRPVNRPSGPISQAGGDHLVEAGDPSERFQVHRQGGRHQDLPVPLLVVPRQPFGHLRANAADQGGGERLAYPGRLRRIDAPPTPAAAGPPWIHRGRPGDSRPAWQRRPSQHHGRTRPGRAGGPGTPAGCRPGPAFRRSRRRRRRAAVNRQPAPYRPGQNAGTPGTPPEGSPAPR